MEDFDLQKEEFGLCFNEGVVDFWAYSYYIDSSGDGELTKDETKKLYESMKKYFEGGGN